ncbi:MAG: PhoU family transcriptional regulator [Campylobacterota bacterium]|nr:PhoU family transcriptional regulator [Campylobacterota bacterium]
MIQNFTNSLDSIKEKVTNIGNGLLNANELILEALKDCDTTKFNDAKAFIKNISSKTNEIDNELIKVLALYTPEARDLRRVIAYMKITNDFSRACANTRSFIKGFTDVCADVDTETIKEYALPMQNSTVKAIRTTINMIAIDDIDEIQECYNDVLIEENKTDDLYEMIEANLHKIAKELDEFEKFYRMLKALRKSGKIADRVSSIANLLVYIQVGGNFHR